MSLADCLFVLFLIGADCKIVVNLVITSADVTGLILNCHKLAPVLLLQSKRNS